MKSFFVLFAILCTMTSLWSPATAQCNCPDDFVPVCGRDMRTYPNLCTMQCANQHKAYDGQCRRRNASY